MIKLSFGVCRFVLLAMFLSFVGCSVEREPPYRESSAGYPDFNAEARTLERYVGRLPWELWPLDYDLSGSAIQNDGILRGDEYLRKGERRKALQAYQSMKGRKVTPLEYEALVLRIASMELALGDTKQALSTVSNFFRDQQRGVDSVDVYFSILLGYGYGRAGNLDQSFAWFSRAHQVGPGEGMSNEAASNGVRAQLQAQEAGRLVSLSERWSTDGFIASLIGRERRRRQEGGSAIALEENQGFESPQGVARDQTLNPNASSKIGVLLPLSGEFASLGESTRNGIELALGQESDLVAAVFKDTGGDSTRASASANELIAADAPAVILGPLLSEQANAVSDVARRDGLPLLTFSKKDSFQTGDGVFRLGPTASSQVESLLEAAARFGLQNFALIYPGDVNGQEFARVFRDRAPAYGVRIGYEASYPKESPDALVNIAREVENARPQAVFLPDSLLNASRFFSLISAEYLRDIRPVGPASWDNPVELNQSRSVLEGAIFVSPFFSQSKNPSIMRFIESYKARYKQAPNFLAAQGFDAATIVAAALRQGSEQGSSFSLALQGLGSYQGLTGTMQVESSGEIKRSYSIVEFSAGSIRELGEANQAAPAAGEQPATASPDQKDNGAVSQPG